MTFPLGFRFGAYKRDAVGRGLYRRKIHEPIATKFLLTRFANSGSHPFIDVDASMGYFSCLMSKLSEAKGKVLDFEPEPQDLRPLEENIKFNDLMNVEGYPFVLGATEGSAMPGLWKHSNRGRHSLLETQAKSRIKVPVSGLDDAARNPGKDFKAWSLGKIDLGD